MDHKTLHKKHKIEQHEPHYNQEITKHCTENIRLSNTNPNTKRDHKTLHRKHKIEQHESHYKQWITKHYAENIRLSNTNPTTTKGSQNTAQKT
jgi:hypothetical protein